MSLGRAVCPQLLCHHQQQPGPPSATEPRNKLPKLNTEQGSKALWASAVIVCVSAASAQLFLVTDVTLVAARGMGTRGIMAEIRRKLSLPGLYGLAP